MRALQKNISVIFLYGESMKVLLSEKQIYQHGTLRKVCAWLSLNALQY